MSPLHYQVIRKQTGLLQVEKQIKRREGRIGMIVMAWSTSPLGLSEDPSATINMTMPVKVEHYIDQETEMVDKIHVLQLGAGRIMEISKLVADGMKFEDAEESVDNSGEYGYPEIDYQIAYEQDIEINIPDDLPVE